MKILPLSILLFVVVFTYSNAFELSLTDDPYFGKASNSSKCKKDSDCSNHGQCTDGSCLCDTFYSGNNCEDRWRDDKSWFIAFIIYGIYATIIQLVPTLYAAHDLYVTARYYDEGGWSKWTLTTYIHIIATIAGTLRTTVFAIDPHRERGILPPVIEVLLMNIPILLWICVEFMILLYWLELQSSTGIQKLVFINRLRPVFIVMVIISSIVLFPVIFWVAITNQPLSYVVFNGLMALVCLSLVVALTAVGINLIQVLKSIFSNSISHSQMDKFLKKLLRYIVWLDAALISLAVTLAIGTVLNAKRHPSQYILGHWILRTEEFALVMATLIFTRKKAVSQEGKFNTSETIQKQSSLPSSINLVSTELNEIPSGQQSPPTQ